MAMIFWSDLDGNVIKEEEVVSVFSFNPPMFSIPNNQWVWGYYVEGINYPRWLLWNVKGHLWNLCIPEAVPESLRMRQLIGAL